MPNTTTTQISAAVNNFYNRTMLKAARPLLLHTRYAQVKDLPRNNSGVIKFRRYALLSANTTALTEGVTPSGTQLSVTDVSGTIAQYGKFAVLKSFLISHYPTY